MITEMICSWIICTAVPHQILGCHDMGHGTQVEAALAMKKANQAGQVFTLECVGDGEKPVVEWGKKQGWTLRGIE